MLKLDRTGPEIFQALARELSLLTVAGVAIASLAGCKREEQKAEAASSKPDVTPHVQPASKADHEFRAGTLPPMTAASSFSSISPKNNAIVVVELGANQPVIVNGQRMPAGFEAGPHRDGILFSKDLKQYVVGKSGKPVLADVPASGIVEHDGVRVDVKAGVASSSADHVQNFQAPVMRNSERSIATQADHMPSVDSRTGMQAQRYEGVTRIEIESGQSSVKLARVDGSAVEARGSRVGTVQNGVLKLKNFGGVINIPPTAKEIKIHLSNGSVTGVVSTPGEITTGIGEITISVPENAPLALDAKTGNGRVIAPRYKSTGNGHFEPRSGNSTGTLKLSTDLGKIQVRAVPDSQQN